MTGDFEALKRLLWEEWDPMGVNGFGPDDEYDSYAFQIFGMLRQAKGEAEIAEYLRWAAVENMALSDAGDCMGIARKAVEIHESNS